MKKRNQKICDFNITSKIQCAKFGTNSKKMIASGDDKNCVQIWQIGESKPISTLSSQNNSNAQVEVASICFSFCEAEIFSGSNRGIINVWDVENKRLLQTLKGHSACVNALCIYPSDENKNLLFSGAYDTSIKQWDLRSKTPINQFKGHTMQINSLAVSPNSKLLASGSNDGHVKVWDIAQGKLIASFTQHDSQIACLTFNPYEKSLASGGADRSIRVWDLDRLNQISMTRTDSTPIQSILINENGKLLFSATHESLKVWDLDHDCQLLDNVESMWRGVQDMIITQEQEQLLGLSYNPQAGFSLHGVPLKSICQDINKLNEQKQIANNNSKQRGRTPDRRQEIQTLTPKAQEPEIKQKSKPSQQIQGQNQINQDNQFEKQKQNEISKDYQSGQPQLMFPPIQPQINNSPYINNSHNINNNQNGYLQQIQQQQLQQQQQQQLYQYQISPSQQNQQFNLNQIQQQTQDHQVNNQAQQKNKQQPQIPLQMPQIIQQENVEYDDKFEDDTDIMQTSELTLSQFMLGDQNKEKFKQVDLIHEISKDHTRINQILSLRMKCMKPILCWWSNNNIKSAINAINQVTDPTILQDALSLYLQQPKFSQIPIESFPQLLEKARSLIESRFAFHIKTGLEFAYKTLCQFREEILNIKLFNQLSKADLAREERIKKYDKVIEQLKIIAQMPKMQKLLERNKDELTEIAKKLQIEVVGMIKKINQNNTQN